MQGATTVYAIDTLQERLDLAASYGAVPVNNRFEDPVMTTKDATMGVGADSVTELLGANRHYDLPMIL